MATITRKITASFDWTHFDRSTLAVGDEITETLKDGREVTFVVMDEGVIGLKGTLGYHPMNREWTNAGGWLASDMRAYINEEVFQLLPETLRAIIKPRAFGEELDKLWLFGEGLDKLWLFSEVEIFGEHIWGKGDEGDTQLEYFKNPDNRVMCDEDGDTDWWWERSPSASYSTYFCYVNSNGIANGGGASFSRGVCFGFYF